MKRRRVLLIALAAFMLLAIPLAASAATPGMGWYKDNAGRWSYNTADGWYRDGWKKVGSEWYLFNKSGYMLTGWQKQGSTWYYLKSSGAMATGWEKINGVWYNFVASGAMQTGWRLVGGKWYHLSASGAMTTGWLKSGSKWYFMDYDGAMMINYHVYGVYYVGADGAWDPSRDSQGKDIINHTPNKPTDDTTPAPSFEPAPTASYIPIFPSN